MNFHRCIAILLLLGYAIPVAIGPHWHHHHSHCTHDEHDALGIHSNCSAHCHAQDSTEQLTLSANVGTFDDEHCAICAFYCFAQLPSESAKAISHDSLDDRLALCNSRSWLLLACRANARAPPSLLSV